jgi:U3 small nucleolar RNA-associated protein 11
MQRLLMAKGGRRKLSGVQLVEGETRADEEDEDEIDSRKGRQQAKPSTPNSIEEKAYKPRVYKWRLERKR